MGRYRSRSYSPVRRKRYDEPRERHSSRRSVRDRRSPGPTGLLVRNISLNSRAEDLRVPFERFGPVKDVYLPKNYYTGEPRGFGFVKFRFAEDAAEAKHQLDHQVIGGREIRVVFAEENRKTPQEMHRMSRVSGRESYGRRSRSRSPRRRYRSYSRSPSPSRHDSRLSKVKQRLKEFWLNKDKRERDHKAKDYLVTFIFKHLQKSLNPSITYSCMHFVVLTCIDFWLVRLLPSKTNKLNMVRDITIVSLLFRFLVCSLGVAYIQLRKEIRAYSWPKKDVIFKEWKPFKVYTGRV